MTRGAIIQCLLILCFAVAFWRVTSQTRMSYICSLKQGREVLKIRGCAGRHENFRRIVHMMVVTELGGEQWAPPTLAVIGLVLLFHLHHPGMIPSPKPS